MGHHITALIARLPYNKELASKFDLHCIEVEDAALQAFVIVALDVYHSDYWYEQLGWDVEDHENKIILNDRLTHFFARQLGFESYALICTDYLGGNGFQWATFHDRGEVVMPEVEKPGAINEALRHLGVNAEAYVDEFEAIGLHHYRNFDDDYEKYFED